MSTAEPTTTTAAAATPPQNEWALSYPMLPATVRLVRLHTRRRLTLWDWEGDTEDAVLITSELVANAVRHARRPGHELWLRLTHFADGSLLIEVSDPVPQFPNFTEAAPQEMTEEQGRGLSIVRALTTELTWRPRGNATGNAHNIQRSGDMASQLNRIGVGDNAGGRALFAEHLDEVFNNPSSVARVQENGRTVREGLFKGPDGMLKQRQSGTAID